MTYTIQRRNNRIEIRFKTRAVESEANRQSDCEQNLCEKSLINVRFCCETKHKTNAVRKPWIETIGTDRSG